MNKKYLCIEFTDKDGFIDPNLSRCPANPEMVMAALQFLSEGAKIEISIKDESYDYLGNSNKSVES